MSSENITTQELENWTQELDSQDNVLIWTNNVIISDSKPLPDFNHKRCRPPNKHPLLKKLLEADGDDQKHWEYTAHLLIQKQTRQYALAVDDILRALKSGTEYVNKIDSEWRGGDDHQTRSEHTENSKMEPGLTQIGRKIGFISLAIKSLQEEQALTFWASQQRVMVLQQLVSFSKDAVKLRRKLARIKASLEERVRSVRRVAIECECDITGNLVPSEIYYQWVKEDCNIYKHKSCDTVNVSLQTMTKIKEKMSAIKETAFNLMPCLKPPDNESQSSETNYEDSFIDQSTLNMSTPTRVYEMDKQIDILHKVCTSEQEEESVCEGSLKNATLPTSPDDNTVETNNDTPDAPSPHLDDVWTPKPSQKWLETIASNVAPPQKFSTYDYIYDPYESRIKEISDHPCSEIVDEINNQNNVTTLNLNILEDKTDPISTSEVVKVAKLNRDYISSISVVESVPPPPTKPAVKEKFLSDSMEQQILLIIDAKTAMHNVVTRTMEAIRDMEREWISPETFVKSKASGKEFYQLVDFIVETAKLTEDADFTSRIYPEDKEEILSVLDPVLRELTNCFMSLHSLHNTVAVDVQYLKELVSGFPKGNLVIRDWVSNSSMDEELAEIEHSTAVTDFDIDVDWLFD